MMTDRDNNPTVTFRHEDKHQIHPREDLVLAKRLRLLLPHDPYAGPEGSYRVTSLYFDTPYDKALREKRDGVDRREKFRLRYYGTDTSFLRLEKKSKVHGLCAKTQRPGDAGPGPRAAGRGLCLSAPVGTPPAAGTVQQAPGPVPTAQKPWCAMTGRAFLYPPGNVRVTLDRNVRSGLGSLDFLNPKARLCPPPWRASPCWR